MKNAAFIDETGSSPGINRVFSRGPKSERVRDRQPCNRGKNITMVAALGVNGLIAPNSMIGGMRIKSFMAPISKKLLPLLSKNTLLVMDNLRVHHAKQVTELIESYGCKPIFLPPLQSRFKSY